jgi:hypothetical protein
MQNSKDHYVPHDYIALLGDSYAAGVGDWLLAGGGLSDKPYHSANVIHDLTHRDVASFGRVNIGSAQMMVDRVGAFSTMTIATCFRRSSSRAGSSSTSTKATIFPTATS